MARSIITFKMANAMAEAVQPAGKSGEQAASPPPDDYPDKLLKLIPAEAVSTYLFIAGIVAAVSNPAEDGKPVVNTSSILWCVFLVLWVLTPFYLWRVLKVRNKFQLGISSFAFAVWVFSIGGPFASLAWYHPVYGGVVLALYTFGVPILDDTYSGPPPRVSG